MGYWPGLEDNEPPLDQESLVVEVFEARKVDGLPGAPKAEECERGWS